MNTNIQRRARARATAQEAQLLCQCACLCAVPCLVSSCDHKQRNIISLASYIYPCAMAILTHKLTLHFQKTGNLAAYKVLGVSVFNTFNP